MNQIQINIRVSIDERESLRALAKHYGLSIPNVIKLLVQEKARDIQVATPAP